MSEAGGLVWNPAEISWCGVPNWTFLYKTCQNLFSRAYSSFVPRLTGQKILNPNQTRSFTKMRKFVLMVVTLASLLAISGTASAWIPPDCAATNCF
jgi:hypothetical protein